MPKTRILVIDDEAAIRDSLRMTLEYEGYEFVGAATGQEGLALVERDMPDLVMLDVKMPGMDGIEVLDRLRARHDDPPWRHRPAGSRLGKPAGIPQLGITQPRANSVTRTSRLRPRGTEESGYDSQDIAHG